MYYKEFDNIETAISSCNEYLNSLEMESELIAGALEKVQDEGAYFQKLKKELGVEDNRAILFKEIDGIEVYFEPSPEALEEVLKKRAEVVEKEIEKCRKVLSILESIREIPWSSNLKVTILMDPSEAKLFFRTR
ncbi:hypothetical protein EYM_00665 [Ignicoccus islandicus DSM 13165]|uniref:Uncharacterized protein n=1 Tax=Ignicoccus islandicus DSM 13165 TaxID=940295 RepID=A0A0U2VDK6_9CREN|nr:hypothetical protein [Ignicoccus islandicus]ALU12130.1 hypothetical protein EYM_00665 [Ignicoccus islandicus DSM 13165]